MLHFRIWFPGDFGSLLSREAASGKSKQRVELTAAERLGFDTAGFMNIIRLSLSARSAAVAHSCRWSTAHAHMKNKLSYILVLGFLLVGCATNPTHPLPALADPSKASEVVVMRGGLIWGSGVAANVTLDGYIVANLFTGKHATLKLNPGEHSIGTTHGSATLNFEPNQKYYFLVNVGFAGGFTTHRIDEVEASKILATSKEVIPK